MGGELEGFLDVLAAALEAERGGGAARANA
jgi:hypothetical protein